MNLIEERKIVIGNKLKKEQANLLLLQERLAKSSQLTDGIGNILNTFEQRLSRLEDTILPVYNETETLRRAQCNIEPTIQLLDNVISHYEVSGDVEHVIEKGPGEGGTDLQSYINALERLSKAQKYFEKNIPQSVELINVTSFFHKGNDKLNAEFKLILDKYNTPILPVVLLDLINLDDSSSKEVKVMPKQIPDEVKSQLIKIAKWLFENGRDEYLTVYGKVRGSVLQKSLTMLRNHQKSVSGGSVHGTTSSPMLKPKFPNRHEASRKPSTRRIGQVFERKANKMFLRASHTLEQSTGLSLGTRRASHLDTSYAGEELDNEQEMENYLISVIALHRLMQFEQILMKDIITPAHQPRVFELIVKEAMDTIVQDGENIVARAKKCIARHDFTTVLVIFPIFKQLRNLKPEFERTVEDYDLNVKQKFDQILQMLHTTLGALIRQPSIHLHVLLVVYSALPQKPHDLNVKQIFFPNTPNVAYNGALIRQPSIRLHVLLVVYSALPQRPHDLNVKQKNFPNTPNVAYHGALIRQPSIHLHVLLVVYSALPQRTRDLNVKQKFFKKFYTTGSKALEDFVDSIRSDSVTQLPSDGTVHEMTSNVIMFLEQLLDYTDTIGIVLEHDQYYFRQLNKLKFSDRSKALLGLYIKKVLAQLNHTLISKSEQYNETALRSLFRLNNNNYVLKSLQRTNLMDIYLISEPNCQEYYYSSIQDNKKTYSQSWNKLLNHISTDDPSINIHSDKLKDKERAVLKEKFAGFNKEIEEISKVQRGYSIPDIELRESIKRDNKELISPKYNAFYNKYASLHFTKNPEKYIKHKPDDVSAIIDRFFDVAA